LRENQKKPKEKKDKRGRRKKKRRMMNTPGPRLGAESQDPWEVKCCKSTKGN